MTCAVDVGLYQAGFSGGIFALLIAAVMACEAGAALLRGAREHPRAALVIGGIATYLAYSCWTSEESGSYRAIGRSRVAAVLRRSVRSSIGQQKGQPCSSRPPSLSVVSRRNWVGSRALLRLRRRLPALKRSRSERSLWDRRRRGPQGADFLTPPRRRLPARSLVADVCAMGSIAPHGLLWQCVNFLPTRMGTARCALQSGDLASREPRKRLGERSRVRRRSARVRRRS